MAEDAEIRGDAVVCTDGEIWFEVTTGDFGSETVAGRLPDGEAVEYTAAALEQAGFETRLAWRVEKADGTTMFLSMLNRRATWFTNTGIVRQYWDELDAKFRR